MRKVLITGLIFLVGCSTYEMENFVKDPHYAQHRQAIEELEHAYYRKEISFTEYQQKRKELEDLYTHEVEVREEKIHQSADY